MRDSVVETGMETELCDVILSSWAKQTQDNYNVYLNKWVAFCKKEDINPFNCEFKHGLKFLSHLFNNGAKYGYIAGARSALSAVIPKVDGTKFGKDPKVKRFVKGVFRLRPQLPKYVEIYDPSIILDYVRKLPDNKHLVLEELVKKLATLICLLSGQRGQTMPLLKLDCMSKSNDVYTFFIPEPLKQTRPGYHQEPLRFPNFPQEEKLCVVSCLDEYLRRTEHIRENLEGSPKELFLSYAYPHKPIGKATIVRYIKLFMLDAGVDLTTYSNHSLRKASTSKADNTGLTIVDIQKAAGWTSRNIFQTHYKLPIKKNLCNHLLQNTS